MATNAEKLRSIVLLLLVLSWASTAKAQTPPSATEVSHYTGIMGAAAKGDAKELKDLIAKGENPNIRDNHGRTPLHVAAFGGHHEVMRILANAGVDPNALENDMKIGPLLTEFDYNSIYYPNASTSASALTALTLLSPKIEAEDYEDPLLQKLAKAREKYESTCKTPKTFLTTGVAFSSPVS